MSDDRAPGPADRLRAVARDPAEDDAARATAILMLADHGDVEHELRLEPGAPAVVASAADKAAEVRSARRLVTRAMAGHAVPAALFDVSVLPAPAKPGGVEVGPASEEERQALGELFARQAKPVTSLPAEVPVVTCGRRAWAIVLDPGFADPTRLGAAPGRPASVASRDLVDESEWAVALEVVTAPRDGAIAIAVVDRRGRTRYVGSATPADAKGIVFSVQAADRPDAEPTRVQGRLSAGRLELTRVERGSGAAQRIPLAPLRARPPATA
jgi:hypothetical protein